MANWSFSDGGADNNAQVKGLGGINGGVGSQGLYEVSTVQNYPLGYSLRFEDGRCFRYAHFVSAANRGVLVAQDFSVSGTTSLDAKYTAIAATGATQVSLTDTDTFGTADAADVYAGGYLSVTDDNGEGYTYRIKSNAQGTSAGVMVLDLYDSVQVQINTESSGAIIGHPYKNLAIANNGTDDIVVGIAMETMAAAEYGWIQTWGVGTVLADESGGTIAAGTIATLSDGVNGAAQPFGGAVVASEENLLDFVTEPILGYFLIAGVDGEHTPIYLQIAP